MFLKTHNKVCVCLYVSNAFAFRHINTEQLCSFRFPHALLTTVGPETFSHPLFNLLVILDITAGASHLQRLPVFVLLSCKEFLWPCLLDFCTTHCFLLVCFFLCGLYLHTNNFQLDKNNLSAFLRFAL